MSKWNPGNPKSDVSYKHARCVCIHKNNDYHLRTESLGIEQFSGKDKPYTKFLSKHCIVPFNVI